jgi:putative membrane protein
MKRLTNIAILFVAVSHIGILVLEMFFWNHPIGQKPAYYLLKAYRH